VPLPTVLDVNHKTQMLQSDHTSFFDKRKLDNVTADGDKSRLSRSQAQSVVRSRSVAYSIKSNLNTGVGAIGRLPVGALEIATEKE
jgi:hypothetical protein